MDKQLHAPSARFGLRASCHLLAFTAASPFSAIARASSTGDGRPQTAEGVAQPRCCCRCQEPLQIASTRCSLGCPLFGKGINLNFSTPGAPTSASALLLVYVILTAPVSSAASLSIFFSSCSRLGVCGEWHCCFLACIVAPRLAIGLCCTLSAPLFGPSRGSSLGLFESEPAAAVSGLAALRPLLHIIWAVRHSSPVT